MSELIYPGDVLVTPKDNFTNISHYSVYIGKCSEGTDWAMHNNPDTGVAPISLNQLLVNGVERIERFTGDPRSRIEIINRAKSLLGKPYSLLNFNCEHFARYVQTKTSESKQVKTIEKTALLGILVIATSAILTNQE